MNEGTWDRLAAKLAESPILVAASVPSEEEIRSAEVALAVCFHVDYREFLRHYGGAMVGPYPIFGLRPVEIMGEDEWSVVDMTTRYRNDGWPGVDAWYVISADHAGNPIGADPDGKIWIWDHDFGGLAEIAPSFEAYLRKQCLKMDC